MVEYKLRHQCVIKITISKRLEKKINVSLYVFIIFNSNLVNYKFTLFFFVYDRMLTLAVMNVAPFFQNLCETRLLSHDQIIVAQRVRRNKVHDNKARPYAIIKNTVFS